MTRSRYVNETPRSYRSKDAAFWLNVEISFYSCARRQNNVEYSWNVRRYPPRGVTSVDV